MSGTKKTPANKNYTVEALKLQKGLLVDEAKANQQIEKTTETLAKYADNLIPGIQASIEKLADLREEFKVQKVEFQNEIDGLDKKIADKNEEIDGLEEKYKEKDDELQKSHDAETADKKAAHAHSLKDLEHKYKTDAEQIGEVAFKAFLGNRGKVAVSENKYNDLVNYKKASDEDIAKRIEDAVEVESKKCKIALNSALSNQKKDYETQIQLKDGDIKHKDDLITRLEADKAKLEKMVEDLQNNRKDEIMAARSGGSQVTVDAKTTK